MEKEKRRSMTKKQKDNYNSLLLDVYDMLKSADKGHLYLADESLSEIFWRHMTAYNIDLNKELKFDHLKPITKSELKKLVSKKKAE